MKKYILTVIAAAMLCGLCSCGDKATSESSEQPATTTAAATTAETTTAETTTAVSTTETAATTAAASSTSAAKRVELDYTPEGADLSVFHYNEDGAVVFDVPIEGQSDATLMAAAQALFQSAHEVNSPFAMGSFPYTIDTNKSVTKTDYLGNENEYFLITDEDINSLDDIIADYQKVFSPKYSYNMIIDTFFTEEGGRVYCICGGRGSDIEYVGSEIISYDGTDGDELMFTVRNHYDGTQWGYDSFDADHDFTAVVDSDGIWRAGKFIQPD